MALIILFYVTNLQVFASNAQQKAVWYRYYDKNGVANLSTSVTPAHIRNGYEALDQNMQVIKRNSAYNADRDQQQSSLRGAQAKQRDEDIKLKRAYGSSRIAINKRDEQLSNIKQQIALQQKQLTQLQTDRVTFKRQEMEFYRKGISVPTMLKEHLKYNTENIANTKKLIDSLQINYRTTQQKYDQIIQRLKKFE